MLTSRSVRGNRPISFDERLKEISMFFAGKDEIHKTLRRLMKKLEKAGIPYAVMGAMAVNAHGHDRTTGDVDILLTPQGFADFRSRLVGKHYRPIEGRSRRFADAKNDVRVDVMLSGQFPGGGKPGPISFPDPTTAIRIDDKPVLSLPLLIELKLAARRHKDFGDVVELIRARDLDESFMALLHPTVQADFMECLEEKRREDEYEAREG
jgi:hypothetical protein